MSENPVMKVSIVTPVFNEPRIQQTLDSIISQQNVPDLEMIVVDGESTDTTPEIIEDYADCIDILIREPDNGVYDAMNKGIRRASGDIVGILNADDQYHNPNVLRSVVEAFESSEADLCYGDLVYTNSDDEVVRYWQSGEYRPRKFYYGWMPPHPTVFVRRDIYERFEPFDLDFSIAADYELLLRLLLCHEISTTYLDKVLVRMSLGGKSNGSFTSIIKANREVYRSWKKNGLRGGIAVAFIKPLRTEAQSVPSTERSIRWGMKDENIQRRS